MQHAFEAPEDAWPIPLRGPRAKVERAIDHAGAFNRELRAYIESEPIDIEPRFEDPPGCWVLRLRIDRYPPLRLSTILGDLVHNARSALDHVAWELARRHLGDTDAEDLRTQISFPITLKSRDFRKRLTSKDGRELFGEDAAKVLERLQPYKRRPHEPPRDAFAILNELWNVDKHRSLHLSLTELSLDEIAYRPKAIEVEQLAGVQTHSLQQAGNEIGNNAALAAVAFPTADPIGTGVDVTAKPTPKVVLGDVGIGPNAAVVLASEPAQVFGDFLPLLT